MMMTMMTTSLQRVWLLPRLRRLLQQTTLVLLWCNERCMKACCEKSTHGLAVIVFSETRHHFGVALLSGHTALADVNAAIMMSQNFGTSIRSATVALGGELRPRMLIKSTTVCPAHSGDAVSMSTWQACEPRSATRHNTQHNTTPIAAFGVTHLSNEQLWVQDVHECAWVVKWRVWHVEHGAIGVSEEIQQAREQRGKGRLRAIHVTAIVGTVVGTAPGTHQVVTLRAVMRARTSGVTSAVCVTCKQNIIQQSSR